jgi:hypothetical protein
MENAREVKRVRTDISCSWGATEACPRNGKITSLSGRGCFVKTTAATEDGQTVFVNCWLPERRWLLLRGSVLYHIEKVGFGLSFGELSAEQKETVASLIEQHKDKTP